MKILLKYEQILKEIYFDKIICFHGTIDNQLKAYENILSGLNGGSKTFLLNNSLVRKKELNIIEFGMNNIFDDLKMTSKSYALRTIQPLFTNDFLENMEDEINRILAESHSMILDKYDFLMKYSSLVKPAIQNIDVKKIISDNFTLVDKNTINISKAVELELLVILNYVSKNSDKDFHLLILHFNHMLDFSQMKDLIIEILSLENLSTYIFLKSFDVYEYFKELICHFALYDDNILYMYNDDYDIVSNEVFSLLTQNEQQEIIQCLRYKKSREEYMKLVGENIKKR